MIGLLSVREVLDARWGQSVLLARSLNSNLSLTLSLVGATSALPIPPTTTGIDGVEVPDAMLYGLTTKAGLVWKKWQDMTNLPIGLPNDSHQAAARTSTP
jgi:hypothetical protein